MNGRRGFLLGVATLVASAGASAQTKTVRIGVLESVPGGGFFPALKTSLRELGWVEGQNVVLEHRRADGTNEERAAHATELVRLGVKVIVAVGSAAVAAAVSATQTTPIVMGSAADPVEKGFVASLARPGGNVTGLALISESLAGKRLSLLKEILPRATRFVTLFDPSTHPNDSAYVARLNEAARRLGVRHEVVIVKEPSGLEAAVAGIEALRPNAVHAPDERSLFALPGRLLSLLLERTLPAITSTARHVRAGWPMSYGADSRVLPRRTAVYVDRILKGAQPADLPVEQPTKFELAFNLKTARKLGLAIPPALLARADQVIDQ